MTPSEVWKQLFYTHILHITFLRIVMGSDIDHMTTEDSLEICPLSKLITPTCTESLSPTVE